MCLCQFKKLVGKSHTCYAQQTEQTNSAQTGLSNMDRFWNNNAAIDDTTESQKAKLTAIASKETQLENEIAAAQVEAENDELADDEIDDLEEEVIDLMDME